MSKNIIVSILIVASISIVWYTFYSSMNEKEDLKESLKLDYLDLTKRNLTIPEILDDSAKFYVILLTQDQVCTTCLNEIVEYGDILREMPDQEASDVNVRTMIITHYDNTSSFEKLIKPAGPVLHVSDSAAFLDEVTTWSKNQILNNQILFYDAETSAVLARIKLLNYSTEPFFKKNLVNEALFSLLNHN